jgi:hypothetical protein
MKKTLMIAATALALTTGAAALNASPAQAGVSVHVGFYGHKYFAPHCVTKYKFVRIKVRRYYGWKWIWVKRPYTYCY